MWDLYLKTEQCENKKALMLKNVVYAFCCQFAALLCAKITPKIRPKFILLITFHIFGFGKYAIEILIISHKNWNHKLISHMKHDKMIARETMTRFRCDINCLHSPVY